MYSNISFMLSCINKISCLKEWMSLYYINISLPYYSAVFFYKVCLKQERFIYDKFMLSVHRYIIHKYIKYLVNSSHCSVIDFEIVKVYVADI